jgi:hypothetical protein
MQTVDREARRLGSAFGAEVAGLGGEVLGVGAEVAGLEAEIAALSHATASMATSARAASLREVTTVNGTIAPFGWTGYGCPSRRRHLTVTNHSKVSTSAESLNPVRLVFRARHMLSAQSLVGFVGAYQDGGNSRNPREPDHLSDGIDPLR